MNDTERSTPDLLVATARELFAQKGYDGTSIRAITDRARVNLAAVTYHFGSKEALYAAVVASVAQPLRNRVEELARGTGLPADRVGRILHAYFDHFADHPDMPKLVIQQLFTGRPLPAPLREAMGGILAALVGVIAEGQGRGEFRTGDPRLFALSTLAQPIYFNIVRRPLALAGLLDLGEAADRERVVAHVTRFALAGLAPSTPEVECG